MKIFRAPHSFALRFAPNWTRASKIGLFIVVLGCFYPCVEAAQCDVPSFAAPRLYSAGQFSSEVAVGDFNRDGASDIAVANRNSTNTVSVFLGDGNGFLQTPLVINVGSNFTAIRVADLNGDGNPDLVAGGSAQLWAILGNGNGTFQTAVVIPGGFPSGMAFGKFGADTDLDMVVGVSGDINIFVRQGNGDGTFRTNEPYGLGLTGTAVSMVVDDMNSDGKADIVVGTQNFGGAYVDVFLGKGDGTFMNLVSTPAFANNWAIAVGDFNLDGTNDVASVDFTLGKLMVLTGNGNGAFSSNAVYTVGNNPQSLAVGHFNADSNPDLLVGASTNLTVLVGNGDGTFQPPVSYPGLERSIALADFNGDGKLDVTALVSGSLEKIGLAAGNGDGTFQFAPSYPVGRQPETVALGDFNGDGWGDIVVANSQTNFVSVLLNNGDSTFQPGVNYSTANKPFAVAVGDFNGDGTNDIAATTSTSTNMVSILLGNGDGTFQPALRHGTFGLGGAIALKDFNGDGMLDILCTGLGGLQVQLGNGDGTFQSVGGQFGGLSGVLALSPGSITIADFNGDHTNDMALATATTNVSIYLGSTNGTWRPEVNRYFAGTNCQSVTAGDFDGDGKIDLASANFGTSLVPDGTVSILFGNGNGTFRPPATYTAGPHPQFITTADFNGDGILDLAVRGLLGTGAYILQGNGDGTFLPAYEFLGLLNSTFGGMAVGDVNSDGKPDQVVLNLYNSVSILVNTCSAMTVSPELTIARSNSVLDLSWPLAAGGFTPEYTTNLSSKIWQPMTEPLTTNNGIVQLTAPFDQQLRFFRLSQ